MQSAVSGLNRGLAANEDDLRKADGAAKELEAAAGLVDLSDGLDKLQGRWKLIYSSAFSSRTLGGSRPGPPIGRLLPITLGQVSSLPNQILVQDLFISIIFALSLSQCDVRPNTLLPLIRRCLERTL